MTSKPGTSMKRKTPMAKSAAQQVKVIVEDTTTRGNLKASEYGRTVVKHVFPSY
jgi:hypothetical protein